MKFSHGVEYAIHGLIYLAMHDRQTPALIADIARTIAVPEAYLRKIFQLLAKREIIVSLRGSHGGFSLGRSPEQISLKDIVEAVEGSLPQYDCLRSHRHCTLFVDCFVRKKFDEARQAMAEVLHSTSLQSILESTAGKEKKITWLTV